MKDGDKGKAQLMGELEGMRQHVAELEGSVSKDVAKEDEKHIRDLGFLSRAATGFLELLPEDNIYEFIAGNLKELAGNSIIIVNSFDEATDCVCCRAVLGVGEKMGAIARILGKHPVGMFLKIDNEAKLGLTSGKLVMVPGGFYEFCFRRIPRNVCRAIEKLLDVGDIYAMGFAWKGKLFGSASIITRRGTELAAQSVIETFIYQASVALQQRQAEQALREARDELEIRVEERTRELAKANEQLRVEIVERKRVEEMIRRAAEDWRTTFDSLTDLISIQDKDFRLVRVNRAYADAFKMKPKEVVGRTCYEMIHGTNEPVSNCPHQETFRTKNSATMEFFEPHLGIHLEVSTSPIFNEKGKVVAAVHVARDITERKQTEDELRMAEQNFRNSIDNSPLGICIVHTEGELLYANQAMLDIYGYTSVEELRAQPVKKRYTTESYAGYLERKKKRKLGKPVPSEYEMSIIRTDGEIRHLSVSRKPVVWDGELRYQVIYQDVTERKQAGEEIAKFKSIADNATYGVSIGDLEGKFVYVNKAYAQMHGYTKDELIGQHYSILYTEDQFKEIEVLRNKTIQMGGITGEETWHKRKDDTLFPVLLNANVIRDSSGNPLYVARTAIDITERKQTEEVLRHSQTLASLGEMMASIAHEVNNPLANILLYSELSKENNLSARAKKDLQVIHDEAKRASKIMTDLLIYSRRDKSQMIRANLHSILKKVINMRQYRQKVLNISIVSNFQDGKIYIKGDAPQLMQVFLNLMLNAEEALRGRNDGKIIITTEVDKGRVKVSFADNGTGISPEDLKQVFYPFYTKKEVGEGTGLGLSTCHAIVTSHNGLIHAQNNDMGGATFIVELLLFQKG